MRVDVQFVNFPKSKLIQSYVKEKILDCIEKFSANTTSVKAFFSVDGIEHHVKISVIAGKLSTCVNANSNDIGYCIDKVLSKLESSLRKVSKKARHKRAEFSSVSEMSDYSATNLRLRKIRNQNTENIFDKFETHFVSDFEDHVRKVS
ncbi:HPF/RaiA family ribosome-associated protein [Fluviispira vulneris]|uniref:HPF/RaiA family ribosome-associated protein n=1 Tax=Fluviispira vulneris TaxID=2763012 RepID=UPI00164547EF|nr:HPF/RaiA family ribosome-associated protein [Fluviispira vulneris]